MAGWTRLAMTAILRLAISAILFICATPREENNEGDEDAGDEARAHVQEVTEAAAPTMAVANAGIFIVVVCGLSRHSIDGNVTAMLPLTVPQE